MAEAAEFFLRTPTLVASNFAALWSTNPKFSSLEDLNLFKKYIKNQEDSYNFRLGFALSNRPHLHRASLVTVYNQKLYTTMNRDEFSNFFVYGMVNCAGA